MDKIKSQNQLEKRKRDRDVVDKDLIPLTDTEVRELFAEFNLNSPIVETKIDYLINDDGEYLKLLGRWYLKPGPVISVRLTGDVSGTDNNDGFDDVDVNEDYGVELPTTVVACISGCVRYSTPVGKNIPVAIGNIPAGVSINNATTKNVLRRILGMDYINEHDEHMIDINCVIWLSANLITVVDEEPVYTPIDIYKYPIFSGDPDDDGGVFIYNTADTNSTQYLFSFQVVIPVLGGVTYEGYLSIDGGSHDNFFTTYIRECVIIDTIEQVIDGVTLGGKFYDLFHNDLTTKEITDLYVDAIDGCGNIQYDLRNYIKKYRLIRGRAIFYFSYVQTTPAPSAYVLNNGVVGAMHNGTIRVNLRNEIGDGKVLYLYLPTSLGTNLYFTDDVIYDNSTAGGVSDHQFVLVATGVAINTLTGDGAIVNNSFESIPALSRHRFIHPYGDTFSLFSLSNIPRVNMAISIAPIP